MNTLITKAIQRFRQQKKQRFLRLPFSYQNNYAIIGTGVHAITNLYPCLWHLGVPVKWVHSHKKANAIAAASRWKACTGTDQIEDIINDQSINGVFIATLPALQADLTNRFLKAGKHVFVEKPIGLSLAELEKVLVNETARTCCLPGLQRRFAPLTRKLKSELKQAISYNYRFCIGAYPEGNVVYDVFIHPIDFVIHLFGEAAIVNVTQSVSKGATSYYLLLNHNGVLGTLELSTCYTWQQAIEEMVVNTESSILTANYPYYLSRRSKPQTVASFPLEKVLPYSPTETVLLAPSFVPVAENNSTNAMGFYPQLAHFVEVAEKGKKSKEASLRSLIGTYKILDALMHCS